MTLDVYGRSRLEIIREGDLWAMYQWGEGKRMDYLDFAIPPDLAAEEI